MLDCSTFKQKTVKHMVVIVDKNSRKDVPHYITIFSRVFMDKKL